MVIEAVGVHETPLATSLTNWVSYRSHFDTWGQLTLKTHCHCEQCCFGLMSLSDPQLLHFSLLFLLHCPTSLSTIFFFPSSFNRLSLCSVQFSRSVTSDSLRPHGLQHARPACPSPTPGAYSNACPLSQ